MDMTAALSRIGIDFFIEWLHVFVTKLQQTPIFAIFDVAQDIAILQKRSAAREDSVDIPLGLSCIFSK